MAGLGEMNDAQADAPSPRPRRAIWPWVLTLATIAFALGMVASPWLEGEVRSKLFGPGEGAAPPAEGQATNQAAIPVAIAPPAPAPADVETAQRKAMMDAQDDRIAALERRFDALDARSNAALANSARAEGMLLALAARRALDTGQPLGVLEGMLRERFGRTQPQAVSALIAVGQRPVTLGQLQAGLQTLEPQLQQASHGGSWLSELRSDIAGLIMIKRGTEPLSQPSEQLQDARQRLLVGDVAGALWQVNRLPQGARQKASGWIAAARHYLIARQALDTLETVALLAPPPGQTEQVIPLPKEPPATDKGTAQ